MFLKLKTKEDVGETTLHATLQNDGKTGESRRHFGKRSVFSRSYFSNGRAVVMVVVVHPSVRLSVTDVLWLNGAR